MTRARQYLQIGAVLCGCLNFAGCKEEVLLVVDVAAVNISGVSGPVPLGAQTQLSASVRDDRGNTLSGRPITWTSSNNNVATVDNTGRVTGVTAGSATITAASEGVSGTVNVDVHNPAPTLTALNPTTVLMQSAAFTLTVTGTGFVQGAQIRWAGANRPTTFVSSTTLTAAIPASDLTGPRYADITVFNPAPGGGASAARPFAVRLNAGGPTITAGYDHTCALLAFAAYCWGSNRIAQLGDGSTTDRLAPTAVTGGLSLIALSSHYDTVCGLDLIGLAHCWGSNSFGVRGSGGAAVGNAPNAVAGGRQYRVISVGLYHACAVDLNGGAWCWGYNSAGQVGDGTTTARNQPTAVLGGLTFVSISAGFEHTCGLTTSFTAYCWGNNFDGRLGDGSTTNRPAPAAVQTALTFASISVSETHSCARTAAGAVYCWGRGTSGQLGQGSFVNSSIPVQATPLSATNLDLGSDFTCAVSNAANVSCWGGNFFGQLGLGNLTTRNSPSQLSGVSAVREVAAGGRHACAITTANEVWCWGSKGRGQLGGGTTAIRAAPVPVTNGTGFSQVQTGDELSCGLRTSGRVACWGSGASGQIGNGSTNDALVPTDGTSTLQFVQMATGGGFACGLVSVSRAGHCWGTGSTGQLGNGSTAPSSTPVPISGNHQFATLTAGYVHACGINSTAQLLCWGYNFYGQLGLGNTTQVTTPAVVTPPAGITFATVSAGLFHTCAASTAGAVFCWGNNGNGQLGDGSTLQRNSPTPVPGLTGIVEVSAGYYHSCARNAAGAAWCWGYGGSGELGQGTQSFNTTAPVQVTGGLSFRNISAGNQVTCAVTTAGQGYCWGWGDQGGVGSGSLQPSYPAPQQVAGGLTWSVIEPGLSHTCGLTSAGVVHCWGTMRLGELGIGTTGFETVPKRVQGGQFSPARLFVRRPRF